MILAATAVTPGMSPTSIIVAVVIAVVTSSALAAGLTGFLNRRKISSEAENIQAQTSDLVWKRVKNELVEMQEQLDRQQARLDTVEPMLRDITRVAHIAFAHIERMYDAWPRQVAPAPPIPHELVEHLPRTIVEDPTIPPAPASSG